MKNLLIFVNPNKSFNDGYNNEKIAKVQIENSLNFASPKDIILATNFDFEYLGVKSLIVPDNLFCTPDKKATKINVIIYLIENKILNSLTWFRDLDAFQLNKIKVDLEKPLGITSYEWKNEWNTGSIFFTKDALQVFKWIKDKVYEFKINEEPALKILTDNNINNVNSFYEKLNVTYNIGMRSTRTLINLAEKPLKVAHFPPHDKRVFEKFKPILTKHLINSINKHYYSL